jgi:5-methylcytosine-specific restriction enzyme A
MNCPLCGRPLGVKIEAHHLTPKSRGGRETVALHPICHRKIHTTFSEAELERLYPSIEALRAHEDIARFILWVARKNPDFYLATYDSRERRIMRRR